jgi:putative transposase
MLARSPNLKAYGERWVRSGTDEALSRLTLVGEGPIRYVLKEHVDHYHYE